MTERKIEMIAWTQVNWNKILGYRGLETDAKQGIEALIEFAGRLCYLSFNKPNKFTAVSDVSVGTAGTE